MCAPLYYLDILVDLLGGGHGASPAGVLVERVLVEGGPHVAPRTRVLIAVPHPSLGWMIGTFVM